MIIDSATTVFGGPSSRYNIIVNAVGFEARARALQERGAVAADEVHSFLFSDARVLDYERNLRFATDTGARLVASPLEFCRHELQYVLSNARKRAGGRLKIGVDVSSMNRTMFARLLLEIVRHADAEDSVDLMYVPAKFSEPRLDFPEIRRVGAVVPELSGFNSEPGLPIALILGLGYEYGTAIGLINQLEPQFTLCLRAVGHDPRFEEEVRRANLGFDFSPYNVEVTEYDLLNVRSAYFHLENIVHSLGTRHRIVLVPMGPKILASILVVIAMQYFGRVAVWRVERPAVPVLAEASEFFVTASVDIARLVDAVRADLDGISVST